MERKGDKTTFLAIEQEVVLSFFGGGTGVSFSFKTIVLWIIHLNHLLSHTCLEVA